MPSTWQTAHVFMSATFRDMHAERDHRIKVVFPELRELKRRSYFYLRVTDAPETAIEYVDPPLLLRKLEKLTNEVRACGRPVRDDPCEGGRRICQHGRV